MKSPEQIAEDVYREMTKGKSVRVKFGDLGQIVYNVALIAAREAMKEYSGS